MPPLTPSGNQNQFFGQKVSKLGVNVNNAGDNELILKDDYSSRIYYNNNGVETVLLGLRRANSTNGIGTDQQGLFVSQDGINVTNATNSQLIFNSNQDVFKIVKSGTSTVPSVTLGASASGTTGFQIIHNLGFAPLAQVYLQFTVQAFANSGAASVMAFNPLPATNLSVSFPALTSAGALSSFLFSYATDSTSLYVTCSYTATGAGVTTLALPGKYYLTQETAS